MIDQLFTYRATCDDCGCQSEPWQDHRPIKGDLFTGSNDLADEPDGWGYKAIESVGRLLCPTCLMGGVSNAQCSAIETNPRKRTNPYNRNDDSVRQTVNIDTVGMMLGIARSTAYERARRDELPVPVIRIGRRMVVSKRALDKAIAER